LASYEYAESADGLEKLNKQCAAQRKLGFNCWFTRQAPLPFATVGAVQTAGQARFHSQRYIQRLAADVHARGCSIFEHTTSPPPRGSAPLELETERGSVHAKSGIVATHSPYLGISEFDFRVFPYQSYVIAARVEEEVADALYWDVADPYHYIRLASPTDPHLLLIGGADHKTGQPLDERERFEELVQYAEDHFHVRSIEHQWSAELYDPADGLPHIGRVPGQANVYVATGFAGTGLTWGTVAGTLLARMITGQRHPLEEILAPGRLTVLASAKDMIAENLDVMRRFVADRFAPTKTIADLELEPGCGEVVKQDGKLVAVCRDSSGSLHRLSPYCTHAGCVVHWNQAEQTWDCPCHGGRFRADGRRFYGPPPKNLENIEGNEEPHE
jgi:nitrite reductase/ring-hydroxylating ferredoxin subunit